MTLPSNRMSSFCFYNLSFAPNRNYSFPTIVRGLSPSDPIWIFPGCYNESEIRCCFFPAFNSVVPGIHILLFLIYPFFIDMTLWFIRIYIYIQKIYINIDTYIWSLFIVHPHFWHRAPKCLGTSWVIRVGTSLTVIFSLSSSVPVIVSGP